jgi:hypothetical protein
VERAVCKLLLGLTDEAFAELGLSVDAAKPADEGLQDFIRVRHRGRVAVQQ